MALLADAAAQFVVVKWRFFSDDTTSHRASSFSGAILTSDRVSFEAVLVEQ
jgi:hypothetical protein